MFNISMGFSDLVNKEATDDEGKNYALFVGDTVLVPLTLRRALKLSH